MTMKENQVSDNAEIAKEMRGIAIYTLAKELNVSNTDILDVIKQLGIEDNKTPLVTLSDRENLLRMIVRKRKYREYKGIERKCKEEEQQEADEYLQTIVNERQRQNEERQRFLEEERQRKAEEQRRIEEVRREYRIVEHRRREKEQARIEKELEEWQDESEDERQYREEKERIHEKENQRLMQIQNEEAEKMRIAQQRFMIERFQ